MASTDANTPQTEFTITIPAEVKEQLREIAVLQHRKLQELVLDFLEQGIHEAMPQLKREHYFKHLREVLKGHNVPKETIDTLEDNFTF
ncbi:hypothetical protein [Desulfogranum mediterraneum]|uniref:hypothetical protein n=1 Tax=Desulfogranum mediterraneum TaxID=160661 RepID=UPI000417E6B5|nr:hypothetical protein [Desulfogranum mediterraneum]